MEHAAAIPRAVTLELEASPVCILYEVIQGSQSFSLSFLGHLVQAFNNLSSWCEINKLEITWAIIENPFQEAKNIKQTENSIFLH